MEQKEVAFTVGDSSPSHLGDEDSYLSIRILILPKFQLRPYDGAALEWTAFWTFFCAAAIVLSIKYTVAFTVAMLPIDDHNTASSRRHRSPHDTLWPEI